MHNWLDLLIVLILVVTINICRNSNSIDVFTDWFVIESWNVDDGDVSSLGELGYSLKEFDRCWIKF